MHGMSRAIVRWRCLGSLVVALLIVALTSLAGAQDVSAAPVDLGTKAINQGDALSVKAPNGMMVKLFITGGTKPFLSGTGQSVAVTFNKVGTFPVTIYSGTGTLLEMGTVTVNPAPSAVAAGALDFVSLPPPAPCSLSTEIRVMAADCVAPSSAAATDVSAAAPPPDFVPDVSIVPHDVAPPIQAAAPAPAASLAPVPAAAPPAAPSAPAAAPPAPVAAPSSPAPAAPPRVALPSAPRTGEGGTAAYARRLGDG